jgi:Fe-S oxidoreductase
MPATANFLTQTPGVRSLAKLAGGYSQKRQIPRFAPETFTQWFARRAPGSAGKRPVILWADTFNNHFTPAVAKAAVEVLEHAGYEVRVPQRSLCCGRPLYDYGMLDTAKHVLRDTIGALRDPIRQGIPIVGLEPSCMTVFRDELPNLLPGDDDARRLAGQSFMLSEFLHDHADGYRPPALRRKALVHGHCHQKSALHFESEIALLQDAGVDCMLPASGCCGMAGSFGYEADHYDVGLACGERVLLPAVRDLAEDDLIVTNGFSCREMIRQETNRRAVHFAQVLQMALHEGPDGPRGPLPETHYTTLERTPAVPVGVIAAGVSAVAALWWALARRKRRRGPRTFRPH